MSPSGGGYYRMHRGWMDNGLFANQRSEPFDRRSAWLWLIEHAAFEGEERGTLSYSVRYLAKAWGWSSSKVFRYLAVAVAAQMIECSSVTGQVTITLCNYDKYQFSSTNGGTPTPVPVKQQRNTTGTNIKECKEGKEKKKDITPSLRSDFLVWYANYPRKVSPKDAERAYTKARAKASAAELLTGIERYRAGKPEYADWAHPATWLNKERWLDQYGDAPAPTQPMGPPPIIEDEHGNRINPLDGSIVSEPGALPIDKKEAAGERLFSIH